MKSLTFRAALGAILALAAFAAAAADLSRQDLQYMKKTAEGLMAEVQMGEMAQKQAEHPDVKAYGQRMVSDHGKNLEQLKQIAASKDVKLPDSPTRAQTREAEKLSRLSGKAFDREYVKYEIKDHKKDIKEQAREMKATSDPDLKQFATAGHATMTQHLELAQSIQGRLGK